MSIALVTFDLDDTLWSVAPVMHGAEAALRDWLSAAAPLLGPVPVEHLWAIRGRLLQADPGLRHRLSELRRRLLHLALREAGYTDVQAEQLAEQGFQVFLQARHQVELFPEVRPTLEKLVNRYCLGVITNGNADVRRLGLADFFRFAFDGSGAENFFDAGSCIDGRLTSAWNWCSLLSKKRFYPIFLLTGFASFDGQF